MNGGPDFEPQRMAKAERSRIASALIRTPQSTPLTELRQAAGERASWHIVSLSP